MFGTKMRSFITRANHDGIKAVVDQQFELAKAILAADLVPIIEPEIDIRSPEKAAAEALLKANIVEQLAQLDSKQVTHVEVLAARRRRLLRRPGHHPKVLRVRGAVRRVQPQEADARLPPTTA